jgi:hypothetical protein
MRASKVPIVTQLSHHGHSYARFAAGGVQSPMKAFLAAIMAQTKSRSAAVR